MPSSLSKLIGKRVRIERYDYGSDGDHEIFFGTLEMADELGVSLVDVPRKICTEWFFPWNAIASIYDTNFVVD